MAIVDTSEIADNIARGVHGGAVEVLTFIQLHPIAGTLMVLLGALLGKIAKDWK